MVGILGAEEAACADLSSAVAGRACYGCSVGLAGDGDGVVVRGLVGCREAAAVEREERRRVRRSIFLIGGSGKGSE